MEFAETGNFASAIEHFTKALEKEENPDIYYERALAYFHYNDAESALADMDKAQELDPANPYRYSSRAYIKNRNGDLEGAIEDYKKAIELDPEDAIAFNNLGLLEEKAGFNEIAGKRFQMADKLAEHKNLTSRPLHEELIKSNGNSLPFPTIGMGKKKEIKYKPSQIFREILNVFKRKSAFLEFIRFIKNGGKI